MQGGDGKRPKPDASGAEERAEQAFTEIAHFLRDVGFSSLFEYFDLERDDPPDRVERNLDRRRRWAQAQQSNPKHRDEALWVIRNLGLCRRVLVERREAYLKQLEKRKIAKNLELLGLFARGAMSSGVLTDDAAEAVLAEARARGVPDGYAERLMEKLVAELGVKRQASEGRSQRDRKIAEALMTCVSEVVAQGRLSTGEVNTLLEQGRQRGLDEQALRLALEQAASRSAATSMSLAPELSGVRALRDEALDAQLRGEAVKEIVDTVRGAMLQGIFGMSTVRSIQRRGQQLGLDSRTVELLVAEASRVGEQVMRGELDPFAVLSVSPSTDHDSVRLAYQELRRWALSLPTHGEAGRACVVLDMAWSLVRTPALLARAASTRPVSARSP